jgi:AcrR family transcriptional regulator
MKSREGKGAIIAQPNASWRELVLGGIPNCSDTQAMNFEQSWIICETVASQILNSMPGVDRYNDVTVQNLLAATGCSRASFYGHRKSRKGSRLGMISAGRVVASIAVRRLSGELATLKGAGEVEDIFAGSLLTGTLEALLSFGLEHPEDARGFLRAMHTEVVGQELDARVRVLPKHPALAILDPITDLMARSGGSNLSADTQHLVRRVLDTGISVAYESDSADLEDVKGLSRYLA